MLDINEAIIVEGKYDKIKLSSLVNATIISTNGFSIFKDKSKITLIKKLATENGIIILTDSDRAGFLIRNYISGCVSSDKIKHAYIPEIEGKERRKENPSKEGFLGVEGVDDSLIIEALKKTCPSKFKPKNGITKAHLYNDGLIGKNNSAELRKRLLEGINLPTHLSSDAMIKIFNALYTYEQYKNMVSLLNI